MQLTYRLMLLSLLIMGAAVGLAFGIGVAYGRGNPKVVDTGLSAQEIQSLVSSGGARLGRTGAAASTTPGASGAIGGSGFAGRGGNGVTGQISAINGNELTITGFQGDVKVTLGSDATISTLQTGSASDLKVGEEVSVAGETQSDGSVNATSVTELPASVGAGRGGFTGGGGRGGAAATATPAP